MGSETGSQSSAAYAEGWSVRRSGPERLPPVYAIPRELRVARPSPRPPPSMLPTRTLPAISRRRRAWRNAQPEQSRAERVRVRDRVRGKVGVRGGVRVRSRVRVRVGVREGVEVGDEVGVRARGGTKVQDRVRIKGGGMRRDRVRVRVRARVGVRVRVRSGAGRRTPGGQRPTGIVPHGHARACWRSRRSGRQLVCPVWGPLRNPSS